MCIFRPLTLFLAALLLPAAVSLADTWTTTNPYRGITLSSGTVTLTAGTVRTGHVHAAQIDLTDPGIHFKVSPSGGTRDTNRQTARDFLNQEHAQLAINSHFFVPFPSSDTTADLVGLAASLGNVYSPFEPQPVGSVYPDQSYAIIPYAPALNIDAANNASIVHRDPAYPDNKHVIEPVQLWNAVSGSAQIVTNGSKTIPTYSGSPNGLTANGTYSDSYSWYNIARARTAIGLTQDSHTLVLLTFDHAGGSDGAMVGEIADMLINRFNVYNALNLDGGGSTTFVMADPTTGIGSILNVSADLDQPALGRSLGSSIAVFAVPEPGTVTLLIAFGGTISLLACVRRHGAVCIRSGHLTGYCTETAALRLVVLPANIRERPRQEESWISHFTQPKN